MTAITWTVPSGHHRQPIIQVDLIIATTTSHDFDHITTPYLAASTTRHHRRQ